MKTIKIYSRRFGIQEEDIGDSRSVTTTFSSVTVRRSNVSQFAMNNNNKNAALIIVNRIIQFISVDCEVLANKLRDDPDGFIAGVRFIAGVQGHDISILSDDAIIQMACDFISTVPALIGNQGSFDSGSSLTEEHNGGGALEAQDRQEGAGCVAMKATGNIGHEGNQEQQELSNQGTVESFSPSVATGNSSINPQIFHLDNVSNAVLNETSTGGTTGAEASIGTAEVAGEAGRALYHANASNSGSEPSIQDFEPIPIHDENAAALSPPHLEQQTENDEHGSMRQDSEDKKPNAKKSRRD